MMFRLDKDLVVLVILLMVIITFASLNLDKDQSFTLPKPDNVAYDKTTNTLNLTSLTLRQKIAQMIITFEKDENKEVLQNMLVGGIHLGAKEKKEDFSAVISEFQKDAKIPFFVTADLEGCRNPFEAFQGFPSLKDIKNPEEAFKLGEKHGDLLKELGFNINFAPVLDLKDTIWKCRSFSGSPEEIAKKADSYILGLEEKGIMATSKHFPGKTIQAKDPHKELNFAMIDKKDLLPFRETMDKVPAVMVSHIIVDGELNSENKPAVVSKKLEESLRDQFTGMIIADEIRMEGLRDYYDNIDKMYIDLFKADNDIILYFETDPKVLYHMIKVVEKAVLDGQISEERIDDSVVRILEEKGIKVIR